MEKTLMHGMTKDQIIEKYNELSDSRDRLSVKCKNYKRTLKQLHRAHILTLRTLEHAEQALRDVYLVNNWLQAQQLAEKEEQNAVDA